MPLAVADLAAGEARRTQRRWNADSVLTALTRAAGVAWLAVPAAEGHILGLAVLARRPRAAAAAAGARHRLATIIDRRSAGPAIARRAVIFAAAHSRLATTTGLARTVTDITDTAAGAAGQVVVDAAGRGEVAAPVRTTDVVTAADAVAHAAAAVAAGGTDAATAHASIVPATDWWTRYAAERFKITRHAAVARRLASTCPAVDLGVATVRYHAAGAVAGVG